MGRREERPGEEGRGSLLRSGESLEPRGYPISGSGWPQNKPRANAQLTTPCSSPTSMAAKTTVNNKIPPGWNISRLRLIEKEVELVPTGKVIMEDIKASSEALTIKMYASAVDVSLIRHELIKYSKGF